jgi:hypothetical protein
VRVFEQFFMSRIGTGHSALHIESKESRAGT